MDKINLQVVRESFGRVAYTQKTHEKAAEIESGKAGIVKWINILLTTLTTSSILVDLISSQEVFKYVSSILSALTLAFVIFQLSFDPDERAGKHRQTAKELWLIREKYINLLADIKSDSIDSHELIKQRDRLAQEAGLIYKFAPQTTSKAYKAAQKALKINEELTFSDDELNSFLPKELHFSQPKDGI